MSSPTYKDAGVNLELYEQSMQRLPALMKRTQTSRVLPLVGGFAGLFELCGDGKRYEQPVLVSGTDGVGTKIKVATRVGRYDTIGIDLVAMCVNDCLCLGAEPLFFLDYLALSKDDPDLVEQLVKGVSDGCVQARAALIGGETAIMPELYAPGEFDLAGFCVGVVEKSQIVNGSHIQPGDVVLGLPSTGLHSNGYSLVRKIVFDHAGLQADDHIPELGGTVGDVLLTPTRIYSDVVNAIMQEDSLRSAVTGIAHITGGGLEENVSRVLPECCALHLEAGSWPVPPVFNWLQQLGGVDPQEMSRVFNRGIGLVLVVRPSARDAIQSLVGALGDKCYVIGTIHLVD